VDTCDGFGVLRIISMAQQVATRTGAHITAVLFRVFYKDKGSLGGWASPTMAGIAMSEDWSVL
jgi:hypothetical protein